MKQKSLFTAICLFLIGTSCLAAEFDHSFKSVPRIQNVTEDSFSVLFTTGKPALCWVEIAPDDGSTWYQKERSKYYQDISGRHFIGTHFCIKIDGLKPGTNYRYRVLGRLVSSSSNPYKLQFGSNFAWNPDWGTGYKWAKTCKIKTLDSSAKECRFSLVNDTHFNDNLLSNLAGGMPEENDFLVLNGDIVSYSQNIDSVLSHTFGPIQQIASTKPVFYVRGNHESRGMDWHLLPYEFPTNSGQFYYSFRQGPAAFLILDAGEDKPDNDIEYNGATAFDSYREAELEWLKKEVEKEEFKAAPQKICIIHIPTLKNSDSWYTQKWISENFTPILEKAGVKLMLSGHHHKYIYSRPGENGCKYGIVVNSNKERADVRVSSGKIHVNIVSIDGKVSQSLDF